jgi:hypothetical protein
MGNELLLTQSCYDQLQQHLFGGDSEYEEAAFLFCSLNGNQERRELKVVEATLLRPEAFDRRSEWYLELTDETRGALIKRAHNLNACLVECHSHPGQAHARFSPSDLHGFSEFVPHVRWRLKGKPYAAIVFAESTFDALVWSSTNGEPDLLHAIRVDSKLLFPTGATLQPDEGYFDEQ